VRYSYADSPYGPFTEGENNPILGTNEDQTVHGPGHHSVLKEGNDYYIVYHKHDYPFTAGGLSRQVSIDKMIFENDSTIKAIVPTSKGIVDFVKSTVPKNIAFKAKTTASSYYHLKSTQYDYTYQPSYATDTNNATMWKAADNSLPQDLVIDLGKAQKIKRVMTQFEFATYYYQYTLEYSKDGQNWKLYADKSDNRMPGSPMIDDNNVTARYLKLTVLGTEKTGLFAAVWNMKVYSDLFEIPLQLQNKKSTEGPGQLNSKKVLASIDAKSISEDDLAKGYANKGSIGGAFIKSGDVSLTKDKKGVTAFNFVKGALILDQPVPKSLAWNGAYTVATWVKNPTIEKGDECLFTWCDRRALGLPNSYTAMHYNSSVYGASAHLDGQYDLKYNTVPEANQWHYLVLTFDGVVEKIYVDGVLDNSHNMALSSQIENAKIRIGASDIGENFTGYMASLKLYDYALSSEEILKQMETTKP